MPRTRHVSVFKIYQHREFLGANDINAQLEPVILPSGINGVIIGNKEYALRTGARPKLAYLVLFGYVDLDGSVRVDKSAIA